MLAGDFSFTPFPPNNILEFNLDEEYLEWW